MIGHTVRCFSVIGALVSSAIAAPPVIDDVGLMLKMRDGLGAIADRKEGLSGEEVIKLVKEAPAKAKMELPGKLPRPAGYGDIAKSVFMIGSVYKCGKCDEWHPSGSATAWSLSEDGLMVTNHHVLAGAKGDVFGVCGVDGKVYPVKEVLAANPAADIAVFRVDPGDDRLTPLALGADAPVGAPVRIMSHPEGRFFFQTSGEVARYSKTPARGKRPERTWMSVTADYAKGSSGGPVINRQGRVVGIVANTQSIYYGSRDPEKKDDPGPLQMVVKNCVPIAALRGLIEE